MHNLPKRSTQNAEEDENEADVKKLKLAEPDSSVRCCSQCL